MNKREKGKLLEHIITDYIQVIDKFARPTRNSGGSIELGDVLNKYFLVEAKNWKKNNCIIDMKIWKKLIKQLPIDSDRTPILVQRNEEGIIFVSLTIDDFFSIVYKAYKEE
jgi:hypothetical protein